MNQTPERQQIDDIEARHNAATKGPWHLTDADTIVAPLTGETIADVWEPTQASRNGEFIENAPEDIAALLAEVRRLTAELAEYEVLNPQQCPAGKHADWLVDSEYAHVCPWCENERLTARVTELEADLAAKEQDHEAAVAGWGRARTRIAELEQALPVCGRSWSTGGDEYPPCARPEDHPEAYCRSADGQSYFLAAPDQPAP